MELENKKNGSGAAHTLKQMDLSKTETDIAETDQKPHRNELLLGTRESIKFVFAKFACSRKHSTVQSNIRNRVLRNIVGCPAGERATHVSQNESFANLLRPSVSLQMGRWMFWKQGFPKTLLGENAGNGRGNTCFF